MIASDPLSSKVNLLRRSRRILWIIETFSAVEPRRAGGSGEVSPLGVMPDN